MVTKMIHILGDGHIYRPPEICILKASIFVSLAAVALELRSKGGIEHVV